MQLPLGRVAVSGDSMTPTLHDGDWLLVRNLRTGGGSVRRGQLVVLRRPDRPGLLIVKRAIRRTAEGWWVEGGNAAASDDSRLFGPVPDRLVLARVLMRYHPALSRLRSQVG